MMTGAARAGQNAIEVEVVRQTLQAFDTRARTLWSATLSRFLVRLSRRTTGARLLAHGRRCWRGTAPLNVDRGACLLASGKKVARAAAHDAGAFHATAYQF